MNTSTTSERRATFWQPALAPIIGVTFATVLILGGHSSAPLAAQSGGGGAMLDLGDAPAPFPSRLADLGARHRIENTHDRLVLGSLVDHESDGQPDPGAVGDDNAGSDDEDGVVFTDVLVPCEMASVEVTVTAAPDISNALLNAWIDFDGDGSWSGNQVFVDRPVVDGTQTLVFAVPCDAAPSEHAMARFRLDSEGGLDYYDSTSYIPDGEIEDHVAIIGGGADMGLHVVDDPDPVDIGGTVTYLLDVTNHGPGDATNVLVSSALDPGSTFVSAVSSAGTCAFDGVSIVDCAIGAMASGSEASIEIEVMAPSSPGTIHLLSEVSADQPDHDLSNNTFDEPTGVQQATPTPTPDPDTADMAISKWVTKPVLDVAEPFVYAIEVQNNGPADANGVTVVDELPEGIDFVGFHAPGGWACSFDPATRIAVCSIPWMPPFTLDPINGRAFLTLDVLAPALPPCTEFTNIASVFVVDPIEPPGLLADNRAEAHARLGCADLEVLKISDAAATGVRHGDAVAFTIRIENHGPDQARDVILTDILPAGFRVVSTVPASPQCEVDTVLGDDRVECRFDLIPADGVEVVQVETRVDPPACGDVVNTAAAVALDGYPDMNTTNNTGYAPVRVIDCVPPTPPTPFPTPAVFADLAVDKTVEEEVAAPGDEVTYAIRLDNLGEHPAEDVRMFDDIPFGVSFVPDSFELTPDIVCAVLDGVPPFLPDILRCESEDDLEVGEEEVIRFRATVEEPAGGGPATVTNLANVISFSTWDPVRSNNFDDAVLEVRTTGLHIQKADDVDPVITGETLEYVVRVVNLGDGLGGGDVTDLTLTDDLPEDAVSFVRFVDEGGAECTEPDATGLFTCLWSGVTAAGVERIVRLEVEVTLDPSATASTSASFVNDVQATAVEHGDPVFAHETTTVYAQCNVDLMLTMDRSGSMNWKADPRGAPLPKKVDVAKDAASTLIESMRDSMPPSQAGLVVFNASAHTLQELTDDADLVVDAIESINADGGTDIADGIEKATIELSGPLRNPSNIPVMVLITDGHDATDRERIEAAAAAAKAVPIKIVVVHIIPDQELTPEVLEMMRNVASPRMYLRARTIFELDSILALVAGAVCHPDGPGGDDPEPEPTDLRIVKSAEPEPVQVGGNLTYTLEVTNLGSHSAYEVIVTDTLPADVTLIDTYPPLDTGTGAPQPVPSCRHSGPPDGGRVVCHLGTLSADSTFTVQIGVQVHLDAPCGLLNVAEVGMTNHDTYEQNNSASASSRVLFAKCTDHGDAPDGTNHYGAPMQAYVFTSGGIVYGTFPTVFDTATGAPPGPRHIEGEADIFLGAELSHEADADLEPDEDGPTNLVPLADRANEDMEDDGVNFPIELPHCNPSLFEYRLTVVRGPAERYVNVWFDFNRDGDWRDVLTCYDPARGAVSVPEWAVQNQTQVLTPGAHTRTTPPFEVYDVYADQPDLGLWMRLSVAEMPAPIPASGPPDGRGPVGGYLFGETEDYRLINTPGTHRYFDPGP